MPSLPTVSASAARIYIDEFELTQQSSGATLSAELATISYNIMGESATHQDVTTPSFSIEHNGFYTGHGVSANLGYFEETFRARLGTTTPVVVTFDLNSSMYTLNATWAQDMTIDAPVAELVSIQGRWASPDGAYRLKKLHRGDMADLATSTPVNLGGAALFKGFVAHVSGFADLSAGAERVNVNVQTSATQGGAYATLWTYQFDKPGAIVVIGADNSNSWARVQMDFTAGVTGPVHALVGAIYK